MMTRGVYLLLAFLFVFSMVNLVNTLMTNLLARQQELGILQSVGMTGKQVSRMLIAECLWYAGVTVFLSVGIGGILGWIFDYVISSFNIFGELSYQFPLMETVVFEMCIRDRPYSVPLMSTIWRPVPCMTIATIRSCGKPPQKNS